MIPMEFLSGTLVCFDLLLRSFFFAGYRLIKRWQSNNDKYSNYVSIKIRESENFREEATIYRGRRNSIFPVMVCLFDNCHDYIIIKMWLIHQNQKRKKCMVPQSSWFWCFRFGYMACLMRQHTSLIRIKRSFYVYFYVSIWWD